MMETIAAFNLVDHFWHGVSDKHGGDLVFIQGHSSPGIYSRAFLLGRLTDTQLAALTTTMESKAINA